MDGMRRFAVPLGIAGTLAIAVILFHLKQRVGDLEKELSQVNSAIATHRETILILRNEWVFLNRPALIAAQAKEFLDMGDTPPSRMIHLDDLPIRPLNGDIVRTTGSPPAVPGLRAVTLRAKGLKRTSGNLQ